eukprot:COSAG01_NODE_10385_length_2179_cov_2.365865_4_plen_62_part_01
MQGRPRRRPRTEEAKASQPGRHEAHASCRVKGSASSVNKISLGKYENSVCHVASTVAVKIDY